MRFRHLNARLERLERSVTTHPEQDRDIASTRRHELSSRKRGGWDLTAREEAELLKLDALFQDEDRDYSRRQELWRRADSGPEPLTDDEKCELAELQRRYPPDPQTKAFLEALDKVLNERLPERRRSCHATAGLGSV